MLARMRLDDAMMEHGEEQICPYCAEEIDEDDVVCPSCGMNLETGRMDAKEHKKRTRKGLDPALFYKNAWSESWAFMLEQKGLALRTGLIWMSFAFFCGMSLFVFVRMCKSPPTWTFWGAMILLTYLGIPGWYWFLSLKIVQAEWYREKLQPDRIHFDFFANVATGLRAIMWPFVVALPFWQFVGIFAGVFAIISFVFPLAGVALFSVMGFVVALPFLAWPLANVHLVGKYRHPAWIGWDLTKIFFRNIGPTLYWHLMGFVMFLPLALAIGAIQVFGGGVNPFLNRNLIGYHDKVRVEQEEQIIGDKGEPAVRTVIVYENGEYHPALADKAVMWISDTIGENWQPTDFFYRATLLPIMILSSLLLIAPITILAGFPAIFMMRANALLAKYNRHTLGVIQKVEPNTPAGCWIRYHAFMVDGILYLLASFLVTKEKKAVIVGQILNALYLILWLVWLKDPVAAAMFLAPIWFPYNNWMYFAIQESSATKTTIGKDVFGLIVLTDDNKQLTLGKATLRWFWFFLLPFLAVGAAFSKDKKTFYDSMTGTKVAFVGDK